MSEETKIAKFEAFLAEIRAWIGQNIPERYACGSIRSSGGPPKINPFVFELNTNNYHPTMFDKYASNPYVDTVLKTTMYSWWTNTINDMVIFVKTYKLKPDRFYQRNLMIFWMLFMAALDDEIFNNELDSIIDIAYAMNFNEAMIRDWCHAVEYIMQGNRFHEGCSLHCETVEGAEFFLHKKEDGDDQNKTTAGPISAASALFK